MLINKILQYVPKILNKSQGNRVDKEDWNYLIILDACRYDIFLKVIKEFPIEGSVEYRFSLGSSTLEFFEKNFLTGRFYKDLIYVTANPTINYMLNRYRAKVFYKVIPVWLYAWNEKYETVLPSSMYYWALKTFINYPRKRIIFHFLQPHYPFIGEKYHHINLIVKEEMRRARVSGLSFGDSFKHSRYSEIVKVRLSWLIIRKRAIASPSVLYLNRNIDLKDIIRAYLDNLRHVLNYAIKLAKILPGKVVITSDHGEAFGEWIHPLIPIYVYGHPNSIHIEPLIKVPWFIINNYRKNYEDGIRDALREVIYFKFNKFELYSFRSYS